MNCAVSSYNYKVFYDMGFLERLRFRRKNTKPNSIICKCFHCIKKSIEPSKKNYNPLHSDRCRCDECDKSHKLERYLERVICSNCAKKLSNFQLLDYNVIQDRIQILNNSQVFLKICDTCLEYFVQCKGISRVWVETDRYPEVSYGSKCDCFWVTEGEWHDYTCKKLLIKEEQEIFCENCNRGNHPNYVID